MKQPVFNPQGRVDVLAYRLTERYLTPAIAAGLGMPQLTPQLNRWAETIIAEVIPPLRLNFDAPAPRRRLCS